MGEAEPRAGGRGTRAVDRPHGSAGRELLRVGDYPGLKLLCWNRRSASISRREAFALYERNWRFVDAVGMSERERALIGGLAREFGNGLINA